MSPEQQAEILSYIGVEQWVLRTQVHANIAIDAKQDVEQAISQCQACPLACETPFVGQTVGSKPKLLIISERINELKQAFSPQAIVLFNNMINALRLSDYFLITAIKCPTKNEQDLKHANTCSQFLAYEIEQKQPNVILTLGNVASQSLLKTTAKAFQLRNKIQDFNNIPVISSFHPQFLLKFPAKKKLFWQDLLRLSSLL